MKIYTKRGDRGQTSLLGGGRVGKDHPRVAAYGNVDELNSAVGLAAARVRDASIRERLVRIQNDLFALGAHLSSPERSEARKGSSMPDLPVDRIDEMEAWIDDAVAELPPLRDFILPGGSEGAATLHLARTICRRAERAVVTLERHETVDEAVVRYLNRLSDTLFTLARLENARAGLADVVWRSGRAGDG